MGSRILYYLVLFPISLLPMPVLYGLSNLLYFFLYVLAGYRKKVVITNLTRSFPEKDSREIQKIASLFYRHFCDLIVESVKMFSISKEKLRERMYTPDPSLPDSYYDKGQTILIVAGHFNNWEMYAVAASFQMKHNVVAIYKKLHNQFFDEKMKQSRGRFGCELISHKEVQRAFESYAEPVAVGFLMDQSPGSTKRSYWMNFLNQDTAVLFGAENYAKKYNTPVLYGKLIKVKRGHYEVVWKLVCDDPSKTGYGEITEKMTRMLEEDIRKFPQYWLWTHKRWKRRRDDGT